MLSINRPSLFSPQMTLTLKSPSWRRASAAAARRGTASFSPWPRCSHPACSFPSDGRRAAEPPTRLDLRASYQTEKSRAEEHQRGGARFPPVLMLTWDGGLMKRKELEMNSYCSIDCKPLECGRSCGLSGLGAPQDDG